MPRITDPRYASKASGMDAGFAVWDDVNSQFYVNAKTPNGSNRRVIFRPEGISFADENWQGIWDIKPRLTCELIGSTNNTSNTWIGEMNDKYTLYLVCNTYQGNRALTSTLVTPDLLRSSTQSLPSECTHAQEPNVYHSYVYSYNNLSIYARVANGTYCTVKVYGLY